MKTTKSKIHLINLEILLGSHYYYECFECEFPLDL
jgi:hypothetical protein